MEIPPEFLTTPALTVFTIRLFIPFLIFKWPLLGIIVSLITDAIDVYIARILGGEIPHYVLTDKLLDTYYLFFACLVSLQWDNKIARSTSMVLFIWRMLGVAAYELTAKTYFLFLAPNVFEYFFIFYLILMKLRKNAAHKWLNSWNKLLIILLLLLMLKIPQEYFLHILQPDSPMGYLFPWMPEFFK